MRKLTYVVHRHDIKIDIKMPVDRDVTEADYEILAEAAARDFYENNGGNECSWPMKFELFNGEESYGIYEVELDNNPTFTVA